MASYWQAITQRSNDGYTNPLHHRCSTYSNWLVGSVVVAPLVCEEKTCKRDSENDSTIRVRYFRMVPSGDVESAVLCDEHAIAWLGGTPKAVVKQEPISDKSAALLALLKE